VFIFGGKGIVIAVNNLMVGEVIGRGELIPLSGNPFDLVVLASSGCIVIEFVSGRDERFIGRP
jgi:hypothetical protein